MSRRAFTLIGILVSLVITLIMMGAVVALFGVVTDSVSGSRALLETADRLRAARNRISLDLQGATVTPQPPRRPESDEGYLELVEGVNKDPDFAGMTVANVTFASLFGDCDDALLLTTRSRGEPFIGKLNGTLTTESQVAEVAYFLRQDGPIIGFETGGAEVRLFTLYRRCMLVIPSSGASLGTVTGPGFYDLFDVSARAVSGSPVANSLGDLTKPDNRFSRQSTTWPTMAQYVKPAAFGATRTGDDVILTNVLAFDVQVFDPGAPVFVTSGAAIEPRDTGYSIDAAGPVSAGAYADLGYGFGKTYNPPSGSPVPSFNLGPNAKSGYTTTRPFVYDTWSMHYEADGVLQGSTIPTPATAEKDLGLNGLDDDGVNGVDDPGEMDTLPPYSAALRGLRITIRVYEPGSQQIRQVTVVQDFLAE